jgi:predicted O-linked N-acetylglucosamine transferase (SPINDLY family)
MLFDVIANLFRRPKKWTSHKEDMQARLHRAARLMASGDTHGAIKALREYLKTDPSNIQALNDLGACLADIGDTAEASAMFELAYTLDDTYIPVVVNHAKLLNDRRQSGEAMPFLRQAKIYEPNFPHVDAVYAGIALAKGDITTARQFQTRAWLFNFDNLRLANCHLFYCSYDDMSEKSLAAEHRFWAETVLPSIPTVKATGEADATVANREVDQNAMSERRVRIGYWSPDFRSHSVRYFFRPLLENHDKDRFEIFLFHDFPSMDEQSRLIKEKAEHFDEVCQMPDEELCAFIQSKQLDILVELAGHSSHNRISQLQRRLAPLQMSALGYPPTTGLTSIDVKLIDRHIAGPSDDACYTELAVALPNSFWCFDPLEEAPIAADPPCVKNGFVTLGCVGNLAKINARILVSWVQIMEALPTSRLLIRSISLEDEAAETFIRKKLLTAGMSLSRIDFHKPQGGAGFFNSYNEIDIILDTYPFNGGTTTCFATYMGVPVVSLFGESLLSRMGLSIMTNLRAPELVVGDLSAYTAKVIEIAHNPTFIVTFKQQARDRFKASSLGNGALYAREFETCVSELLNKKLGEGLAPAGAVATLPVNELVRRAYAVYQSGNSDAAHRIVAHCLREYPTSASSHLLKAQQWLATGEIPMAINYLQETLPQVDQAGRSEVLLMLTRLFLLSDQREPVASAITQLGAMEMTDAFDKEQAALYKACLTATHVSSRSQPSVAEAFRICVLVPCNEEERFDAMQTQIRGATLLPPTWELTVRCCDERHRIQAYQLSIEDAAFDTIVVVQKNVEIHAADFFVQLQNALAACDLVSFAGATRWSRLDWRVDEYPFKRAGFITPSAERAGAAEVQIVGHGRETQCAGMAVLDGSLFAFNRERMRGIACDEELLGGESLLEEDWVHSAFRSGCTLQVLRSLGVLIDTRQGLDASQKQVARLRCTDKLGFDPFATTSDSYLVLSAPVSDPATAVCVMNNYFGAKQ